MKTIILILILWAQPAFSWFYVSPETSECKETSERYTPEALMNMTSRSPDILKCKKKSEDKVKVVLDCKSKMVALNGRLTFYSNLEACKNKK